MDSHLERTDLKTPRLKHARNIEELRQRIIAEAISYQDQVAREHLDHRKEFFKVAPREYAHLCEDPARDLVLFGHSPEFLETPCVSISARLYAALLTASTRPIKDGDATDIDVLSTFLPYMDVVGTDHFMATQVRTLGIDREFDVKVYSGKTASLQEFIAYIQEYVNRTGRVHRPAVSVFVLPTPDIKEHSFAFYRTLGLAAKRLRDPEYAEIFGFDDGNMPQYELGQMRGTPLQFYGLMDVDPIPLPRGSTMDDILKLCREHCESDQFVLIDKYQELSEHFFDFVLLSISAKKTTTGGYAIYKKTDA